MTGMFRDLSLTIGIIINKIFSNMLHQLSLASPVYGDYYFDSWSSAGFNLQTEIYDFI